MSTLTGGSEAQILIKMATLAKPIICRKSFKRGKLKLVCRLGGIKIEEIESKNAKVDLDYGWYLVLVFRLFFVVLGSR